MDWQLPSQAI